VNLERYPTLVRESENLYIFESVGVKGSILKVVQYTPVGYDNIYQLGFGDYDPLIDEVDDIATSNNGDSDKVLATVVYTIYLFTNKHPNAKVVAFGSTASRNRLYRIGISKYLEEAKSIFHIFGDKGGKRWEPYKRSVGYERYMVIRK